jgi:dTDP-4-amino-4,6-dideoxygalactose transaminase
MKGDGQRQYDDNAIQKFVESKSDIELDQIANQMKGEYAKQMAGKITQEQGQQIEQINQKNAKIVEAYTEKLKTENSIFGIDLPEAEKTEVITAVQKMFVKDKTGTSEFDRIMQNDQIVLQIAPILHLLNTGKLQGLVSTMKETIKAKETDKLDPKPNIVGGSVQGPEGIDEKALVD